MNEERKRSFIIICNTLTNYNTSIINTIRKKVLNEHGIDIIINSDGTYKRLDEILELIRNYYID